MFSKIYSFKQQRQDKIFHALQANKATIYNTYQIAVPKTILSRRLHDTLSYISIL